MQYYQIAHELEPTRKVFAEDLRSMKKRLKVQKKNVGNNWGMDVVELPEVHQATESSPGAKAFVQVQQEMRGTTTLPLIEKYRDLMSREDDSNKRSPPNSGYFKGPVCGFIS
mmetsp:Transcript_25216/g.69644  ORF Transcript_25216/g.69644 Transcript_25216/m.69644 type:complete len:112 (+) Transcript_25216:71-406(+)